jgi:hypothetical protein
MARSLAHFSSETVSKGGSLPYSGNRHSISHIQGHYWGLLSGFGVSSIVSLSMSFGLLAFQEVSTLNMA